MNAAELPTAPPRPPRAFHDRTDLTAAQARLVEARRILSGPRLPGSDHYPADAEMIQAWHQTRSACTLPGVASILHLDGFLCEHLESLRDLMLRARYGRAPGFLLDELAEAIADQLAQPPASA